MIIAHVVNPYGMSWRRRWNENNVDLNRNFLLDNSHCDASHRNAAYPQFKDFIYPGGRQLGMCDCFLMRALYLIARYGYDSMKQVYSRSKSHCGVAI